VNLIIIEPDEVRDGLATLYDTRAKHILGVLKAAPGTQIRIGLLNGPFGLGTVVARDDQSVTLHCDFEPQPPPRPVVDLLLALPRPKVMHRLWAQLSALGVGRIMLTNAERVERNYFDTHVLVDDVYTPLLLEGLQQARDTHLPIVTIHRQLKVLVEDQLDALCPSGIRLVAHPGAQQSIAEGITTAVGDRALVAVGPEGGWNDFELQLFQQHRFQPVGLGARTLRVDTACLAVLTLVHCALARATLR
jgi:RsmE family RNA methyltransferase